MASPAADVGDPGAGGELLAESGDERHDAVDEDPVEHRAAEAVHDIGEPGSVRRVGDTAAVPEGWATGSMNPARCPLSWLVGARLRSSPPVRQAACSAGSV